MTLSVTCESPWSPPLVGAIASNSSKKIIHGAACVAFLKISLTPFSDSPTHLLSNSGPLMLIKLASLSFAAVMLALREHITKYPDSKEAEKQTRELKISMKHFEEAMKKIRPLSSQELDMYKNVANQFGRVDR